ncbi:exopolyphosphatase [Fretibacterium fastidiosum]|uniref:exopolyphosphatase n=1 Tax=Fretibacterium fastidiosum TaxID=651822 RepID=UPI0002DF926A|nr:exopolyphosphatase [Fretibacterium fastidiosum]
MRLLTRSDFDGLMCAVLLKELDLFDDKKFVHPKDIQDGVIEVNSNDILVNIPYAPGCGMWFDHHTSEDSRGVMHQYKYTGASWPAPSCARVIYEYYGGGRGALVRFKDMVVEADKCDSAHFTRDEVLNPQGMVLLSFIMDPRTGLGRYRDFRISNYQLMDCLIDYLRTMSVDEIMQLEDLQERVRLYDAHKDLFVEMMKKYSWTRNTAVVTDLRGVEETYVGNRHVIYALFPDQNVSVRVFDGKNKEFCVFSVGYSILNRTATVDVGKLMLKHGGGGHRRVGTCQVPYGEADAVLEDILTEINKQNWQMLNITGLEEG